MAQGDPKLPARPGYITRKSGYSNIRIKDVYAPGTGQNPVLGEFVNFSASLAKKLARDKQLEQSEAKSYLASRRAKLQKQNEDRDRASAEAHHLSAVGTFREAVNNKDIHATQTPIWWQNLAEISGIFTKTLSRFPCKHPCSCGHCRGPEATRIEGHHLYIFFLCI